MIKTLLKLAILKTIQLIEWFEYRNLELKQSDPTKKIINSVNTSGIEVFSDTGWVPFSQVHITQPFTEWILKTDSGKTLKCADEHRIFTQRGTLEYAEIFVDDLEIGDLIHTIDGLERVTSITKSNNKYSMFDISVDHANHRFYTNGILSHNTVTSSIFIAWYVCFHYDRNTMVVANKLATTSEIIDKIKIVLNNLPFFMKPGIISSAVTSMKFDNGNKLYSQATTKTAAIGFTIHLLFADEFAHIHANFLEPFYRSIYPTLSSSSISRMIITSTPHGMNLFYQIYTNAVARKNAFNAIRVDWWQVPGRDENWKRTEIANLGSEELFNQEYGNQFLASSRLLLSSKTLQFLRRVCKHYAWHEIEDFLDYPDFSQHLNWANGYDPTESLAKDERIVFVVDLGDGVGRDYSIINIFKLEPQSVATIRKIKDWRDESSFFRLRQIGLFRANVLSVEEVAKILEILAYGIYNPENISIVLEVNFKGEIIVDRISRHKDYFPEMFLHTKHSASNETLKIGIKLQKDTKEAYSRELRSIIDSKKIVLSEIKTFEELASFGLNQHGRYEAQAGHDDIALTCVNLIPFFNSNDFYEMVEGAYDLLDYNTKQAIAKRINVGDVESDDIMDLYREIGKNNGRI